MAKTTSQRQALLYLRLLAGFLVLADCFSVPSGFERFMKIMVTLVAVLNIMAVHKKHDYGPLSFFIVTALIYNPFIRMLPADEISILINLLFATVLILSWWRRW